MPDKDINWSVVLVSPLARLVRELAAGVAQAQRELDQAAIDTQKNLARDHPELEQIGYQVTWYHMPEVEVEMKVAVHYESEEQAPSRGARVLLAPFNAKYSRSYNYVAEGASKLRFRIVPIPPAHITEAGSETPS